MVTEPSQWQHLPTGENPADLSTRGAALDELLENSLWWHEPKWLLSEDKAGWPKMDVRSHPLHYRNRTHQTLRKGKKMLQVLQHVASRVH